MAEDLTAARLDVVSGRASARSRIEASLDAAARWPAAFVKLRPDAARVAADAADQARRDGRDPGPLAGLAISVKDLFDVEGEVTSAGSTVLEDSPPARRDAAAVARLRAAGAALIGRTQMSEFAFSGVGLNPHHAPLANPATAAIDPLPRVPGGSTSGGAASVASGAAWAALGSDTGGSLRIPAALQGLVGFKCTARLVPSEGAVPLSTTLDTVGAIGRSVRDAILLHEVLAGRRVEAALDGLDRLRLAIPRTVMLDALDDDVADAFERAVATLAGAGATVERIELAPLAELAPINATGGFSAAESWAWHRRLLAEHEARYDPRVALRIRRGEAMSAADYIDLHAARKTWVAAVSAEIEPYDALLSPTVPIVAPPLEPLVASDDAFFAANNRLLRNPSAVNFLDGCAISLPCHAPGRLPVGLMLWHGALRDDRLLGVALAVEAALVPAR